ncbi:MAG: hypothetical protein Kilf2KO_18240 [Rhodospirillales bacterium]
MHETLQERKPASIGQDRPRQGGAVDSAIAEGFGEVRGDNGDRTTSRSVETMDRRIGVVNWNPKTTQRFCGRGLAHGDSTGEAEDAQGGA